MDNESFEFAFRIMPFDHTSIGYSKILSVNLASQVFKSFKY
jgi:hypothetical protein